MDKWLLVESGNSGVLGKDKRKTTKHKKDGQIFKTRDEAEKFRDGETGIGGYIPKRYEDVNEDDFNPPKPAGPEQ
jgi:hypothetical protein